jgi:hypothetical protein
LGDDRTSVGSLGRCATVRLGRETARRSSCAQAAIRQGECRRGQLTLPGPRTDVSAAHALRGEWDRLPRSAANGPFGFADCPGARRHLRCATWSCEKLKLLLANNTLVRLFVLLVGAVCFGSSSARAREIPVLNLAGSIVDIAQSSQIADERIVGMEKLVLSHQDIYSRFFSPEALQSACRAYIIRLEPQLPGLRRLADDSSLQRLLENHLGDFERAHPGFDRGNVRILLLPSLGYFRGQARRFSGRLTLMLDLEFLSTAEPRAFRAMFHHELFHIYHYQVRSEVGAEAEVALDQGKFPSLATLLWVEGMATCATRELNPAASEADLAIDVVARSEERFWSLLDTAMAQLHSTGREAISGFFYFPTPDNSIPVDCGYRIGEALIRTSRSGRTWQELLSLSHSDLVQTLRVAADGLRDSRNQLKQAPERGTKAVTSPAAPGRRLL